MPQRHRDLWLYLHRMADKTTVFYNDDCPVCRFEITAYRRYAIANDLPLVFDDLARADLATYGLTKDDAARRLYLVHDGALLAGMDAFRVLWREMPRYKWIARATSLPILRPVSDWAYDRVIAPLIYAMHTRRQAKQG